MRKVGGYIKRETNSNQAESSGGLSWFFYDNMLLGEVRGINLEIGTLLVMRLFPCDIGSF